MKHSFTQTERAEHCVLPLEQAVYRATKDQRGSTGAICEIHGLKYNTVAHQLNPDHDSHTLSPQLIEIVLSHTKDTRILDSICAAHGGVGWFLLPQPDELNALQHNLSEVSQSTADLFKTTLASIADDEITADELASIRKDCHMAHAAIQALLQAAEAKALD